jgi:hypothetical protein
MLNRSFSNPSSQRRYDKIRFSGSGQIAMSFSVFLQQPAFQTGWAFASSICYADGDEKEHGHARHANNTTKTWKTFCLRPNQFSAR